MTRYRDVPASRFYTLFQLHKDAGLTDDAAYKAALLAWWGEHYGYRAPRITSGYRSPSRTRFLQQKWDRGDRSGLVVRPASSSIHHSREAWDWERVPHLYVYGYWAPSLGVRWGGDFSNPDPVHFDLGR